MRRRLVFYSIFVSLEERTSDSRFFICNMAEQVKSREESKDLPTSVTKGLISSLEKARQVAERELATITELFSRASPPNYITALKEHLQPGPIELLWKGIGGCACGNCGDSTQASGDAFSQSCSVDTLHEGCYFTQCEVNVPSGTAYSTSPESPMRLMMIFPSSYGDGFTWPILRVLSNISHLAIGEDGIVKNDIFEIGCEHLSDLTETGDALGSFVEVGNIEPSPPSILNALRIFILCLTERPPPELFGGRQHASDLHTQWQHMAAQQRMMGGVISSYRLKVLQPALFGADPHAVANIAQASSVSFPIAANDPYKFWRPSSAFPEGILDAQLIECLTKLRSNGLTSNKGQSGEEVLRSFLREDMTDSVFSFPLFTPTFCLALLRELENFEASGLPARRPNSMNNYGTIVNQIGLEGFMTKFQDDVSRPLSMVLFPDRGFEWLDNHHSFSVRYTAGEDLGLDMHTDDSHVTVKQKHCSKYHQNLMLKWPSPHFLFNVTFFFPVEKFNVCLGKAGFSGAGLTFCGQMGHAGHRQFQLKYRHELGRCVVHLGNQRHGADDIEEGTRVNLIVGD